MTLSDEKPRLLAVDDDDSILPIIAEVGAGLGFEVETLLDSSRFMTTYVRVKPHVLTLDLMMPDMDGIEIIRWLSDIGSSTRVVILSGGHPTYVRLSDRLAQARGVLHAVQLRKPFALADLRAALIGSPPDAGPASVVTTS
jgi:DNA-binding response OmpR family regulator